MNAQVSAFARCEPKHMQHRRNARLCGLLAKDAQTELDRWTLLTMQQSWLALAENEEWLSGQRTGPKAMFDTHEPAAPQTVFWGS